MIPEYPLPVAVEHFLKGNINIPHQKRSGQQQKKNKRNGKFP